MTTMKITKVEDSEVREVVACIDKHTGMLYLSSGLVLSSKGKLRDTRTRSASTPFNSDGFFTGGELYIPIYKGEKVEILFE